jgi:hypothetical protein
LHVGRQKTELARWDVGPDSRDDVECVGVERVTEVSKDGGHAVLASACDGSHVDIDTDHRGLGSLGYEMGCDRAGAGAEIGGVATFSTGDEKRGRSPRQVLALEPRYVDATFGPEGVATELQRAGDPGQRFALLTSSDPQIEHVVVGRCGEKFVRLLLGRNASRRSESGDDR